MKEESVHLCSQRKLGNQMASDGLCCPDRQLVRTMYRLQNAIQSGHCCLEKIFP